MMTSFSFNGPRGATHQAPIRTTFTELATAFLLCAGLDVVAPAAANAQTVSQAFINLFSGAKLWVDPSSSAQRQADAWRRSRPRDAELMDRIASQPVAKWVGGWNVDIARDVSTSVSRITGARALPVFVAYNIPGRDCGMYSGGGARGSGAYKRWIRDFAKGLGGRRAVVILEPDGLAGMGCLNGQQQQERVDLLHDAVRVLKAQGAAVYIDAGNARWVNAADMAERLKRAGIAEADGFALNIANFLGNSVTIAYGTDISRRVGGKHFIIDTSRNGMDASSSANWCNPSGQRIGAAPTTRTGHRLVDAFLWVKAPGESDGSCSGGPGAGKWWAEYALGLAGGSWDRFVSRR